MTDDTTLNEIIDALQLAEALAQGGMLRQASLIAVDRLRAGLAACARMGPDSAVAAQALRDALSWAGATIPPFDPSQREIASACAGALRTLQSRQGPSLR